MSRILHKHIPDIEGCLLHAHVLQLGTRAVLNSDMFFPAPSTAAPKRCHIVLHVQPGEHIVHIYLVDRHFEELCLCAVRNIDEVHNVVKQMIHTE